MIDGFEEVLVYGTCFCTCYAFISLSEFSSPSIRWLQTMSLKAFNQVTLNGSLYRDGRADGQMG
jgi:hypothetical protein